MKIIKILLFFFVLFQFLTVAHGQDLQSMVKTVKIVNHFSQLVGTVPQGHRLARVETELKGFFGVSIPSHLLDSSSAYISDKSNDVQPTEDEHRVICFSNALMVKSRPDSASETVTNGQNRPVRLFKGHRYAATGERLRRGNSFWYEIYLLNEYSQNIGWVTNDGINKNNFIQYESSDCRSPFVLGIDFESRTDTVLTAKKGTELTLSLGEMRGNSPLTFVWYKDDEEVFEGKKNPVLIISDFEKEDEGEYICVVRNSCGSYVSRNFKVNLIK